MAFKFKEGDLVRVTRLSMFWGIYRQPKLNAVYIIYGPTSSSILRYLDEKQYLITMITDIELVKREDITKLEAALYGL